MSSQKVLKFKHGGERKREKSADESVCSFCGRGESEVLKMVKGPGVNICSECTMIAVQYLILNEKMLSGEAQQILDAFWHKK